MKILFVCEGNVGRSQMAEAFYNYFTKSFNAASAGTKTSKNYKTPSGEVVKIMLEENVDISGQRVKPLTESMVNEAEKIIIFCKKDLCPQFLLSSKKVEFVEIPDPYQSSLDNHRKIRDSIRLEVEKIVKAESFKIN